MAGGRDCLGDCRWTTGRRRSAWRPLGPSARLLPLSLYGSALRGKPFRAENSVIALAHRCRGADSAPIYIPYSLRCSKRSHPARDRVCTKRSHSARRSGIWTLLPLVIAQKKMHLRGIELETSSLECFRATAATNQA
jgi:hypothetical protein